MDDPVSIEVFSEPWIILEGNMMLLWKLGYDTWQIARKLEVREHEVANRLWHLRGVEK